MTLRDAVGGREDDDVRARADRPRGRLLDHQIAAPREVQVDLVDAAPRVVARQQRGDLEAGVPQEELEDAEPAVAGGPDDLNP